MKIQHAPPPLHILRSAADQVASVTDQAQSFGMTSQAATIMSPVTSAFPGVPTSQAASRRSRPGTDATRLFARGERGAFVTGQPRRTRRRL